MIIKFEAINHFLQDYYESTTNHEQRTTNYELRKTNPISTNRFTSPRPTGHERRVTLKYAKQTQFAKTNISTYTTKTYAEPKAKSQRAGTRSLIYFSKPRNSLSRQRDSALTLPSPPKTLQTLLPSLPCTHCHLICPSLPQ